jgi:CheY-like chemotaxis protein
MKSPKCALVVDDNRLNSRLVEIFLKRLGWSVVIADTGNQAMLALQDQPFDVVLLDLRMPEMGGEEVCRTIRQTRALADLRVVAYTAHSLPDERDRLLASGFNSLLTKPITFADVTEMCAELQGTSP